MKALVAFYATLIGMTATLVVTAPDPSILRELETFESTTLDTIDYESETREPPTVETMRPDTDIPETELPETTIEETTEPETTVPPETEPETTKPVVTDPPETVPPYERPDLDEPYITLTDEEKRILATLIRLEAGGASYECQMAVGSVVLNRMAAWDKSLEKVVFQRNQFSPAYLINRKYKNGEYVYKPYDICWEVVDDLCENGPTLPYYVLYFRAKHYHKWSIPYCEMDGTYFSYLKRDK